MSRHHLPKAVVQQRLLRLLPAEGGLTTTALFDAALADGMPAHMTADGPILCDFPFESVLKYMRRAGWVFCNKYADPHEWVRTPTGTAFATGTTRPAKIAAARRQEVPA